MMMTTIATDGAALPVAEVFEDGLELYLGDGNTFADLMGCGVLVIDQVDVETQEAQSVVLTQSGMEALLSSSGASLDLGEGTTGHYMGCGVYVVDQVQADGGSAQRIVLSERDLRALLAGVR